MKKAAPEDGESKFAENQRCETIKEIPDKGVPEEGDSKSLKESQRQRSLENLKIEEERS